MSYNTENHSRTMHTKQLMVETRPRVLQVVGLVTVVTVGIIFFGSIVLSVFNNFNLGKYLFNG